MIVELDPDGWKSTEYSKYKPYHPAPRNYDWRDYHTLSDDGMRIVDCHHCDIRRTGCQSPSRARYNCHKKVERQSNLFEFKG